jgi:heme-degrading monooxygenase HmoA
MEVEMAHLLIKHKVKDYPSWKKVFDGFIETRRAGGEKSFQIMHPQNDANNLLGIFEWDTLENAQKFANSSELKEVMGNAGVIDQPEVYFLEEYAAGKV